MTVISEFFNPFVQPEYARDRDPWKFAAVLEDLGGTISSDRQYLEIENPDGSMSRIKLSSLIQSGRTTTEGSTRSYLAEVGVTPRTEVSIRELDPESLDPRVAHIPDVSVTSPTETPESRAEPLEVSEDLVSVLGAPTDEFAEKFPESEETVSLPELVTVTRVEEVAEVEAPGDLVDVLGAPTSEFAERFPEPVGIVDIPELVTPEPITGAEVREVERAEVAEAVETLEKAPPASRTVRGERRRERPPRRPLTRKEARLTVSTVGRPTTGTAPGAMFRGR